MNQDSAKKLSLWLPLTFLVGLFGLSCSAPDAPKVTFEDRPSSYSVSKYQGAATDSSRHYLSNSDEFIGANQSSLNRAIADLSAADQARAAERERRDAEWRAKGSPISCPHCHSGRAWYRYNGIFGETIGDRPCTYCHGTGYVSSVRP